MGSLVRRSLLLTAALLAVPAAASAAYLGSPNAYYAGKLQASASGTSVWYMSRPYINIDYIDRRQNGYDAYARGRFYQKTKNCLNIYCTRWVYVWGSIGNKKTSKINPSDGWTFTSVVHNRTGRTGAYGAGLDICVDVSFRPDPCGGTGIHSY